MLNENKHPSREVRIGWWRGKPSEPGMDGLGLLQELKGHPVTESIPIVLLTARLSLTEPQRFQELGVKGAIAKPFNSLTLVPQIANALGWNLETQY